jgi:hypothetical protein
MLFLERQPPKNCFVLRKVGTGCPKVLTQWCIVGEKAVGTQTISSWRNNYKEIIDSSIFSVVSICVCLCVHIQCPEITPNTLEVVSFTKTKMKLSDNETLFDASVSSTAFFNLRNVAVSHF